ncbi:hypothetical protein BQ8794_70119 [Mesorhizobium prunaredense]|uniref:Uncharacterized protein n=1 Tax=Mesorhizobium prunaredense TaxID=1631249 RepID=A0A1R3VJX9_9HYPH|nr:hypothetical protein BQ8794_70119 [Mesorhizobium prunaredense]
MAGMRSRRRCRTRRSHFASKEPINGDVPQTQSAWRARFEIFSLMKLYKLSRVNAHKRFARSPNVEKSGGGAVG